MSICKPLYPCRNYSALTCLSGEGSYSLTLHYIDSKKWPQAYHSGSHPGLEWTSSCLEANFAVALPPKLSLPSFLPWWTSFPPWDFCGFTLLAFLLAFLFYFYFICMPFWLPPPLWKGDVLIAWELSSSGSVWSYLSFPFP
jgi:hypothetical protein